MNEKGFTVFAMRHGSWPRYPMPAIVADMRRSVRFIRQHAKDYGVDPNRIGVFGGSAGRQLALLLNTTGDSGDPALSLPRPKRRSLTHSLRLAGSAPSLIVHGDADTAVPMDQGETTYAALSKAGVPASFIRIKGAEHGFDGAAPADLSAPCRHAQWFERHLGSAAK